MPASYHDEILLSLPIRLALKGSPGPLSRTFIYWQSNLRLVLCSH
jgi:hypothetical protein